MTRKYDVIPGELITLNLPGKGNKTLDGFWTKGKRQSKHILVFVHGMGSNFYKSRMKKAWMTMGPKNGLDVFCFNNRGFENDVADERFSDCLVDIDAALHFVRSKGYKKITLLGHSTGCQKITYYWSRRKPRDVDALVLAALGDDMAIAQRELGRKYTTWINKARALVKKGRGDTVLPPECLSFTARRFLSAVDPKELESKLFHLDGQMRVFRSVKIPIIAVFPENEQYACIPVSEAAERLRSVTKSVQYQSVIVPDADHSFHGQEKKSVTATLKLMKKIK